MRRLEENGLIYTAHLETDQRQIVLQLSDKGFALVDKNINKIHAILDNTNEQITQGSSVVEVEQFEAFLDQIIEGFK